MDSKNFKKPWFWAVGLLFGTLLYFLWPKAKLEKDQMIKPPLNMSMVIPGKVESVSQEIQLSFDRPGTIQKIYVKERDEVKAGQLISELVHDDLEAQVEVATAAVEESQANIQLLETEETYMKDRLARREQLGTVVSQEDLEQAKIEFDQASGKRASSRALLKVKEGELQVARANLSKVFLKAPIDGRVVRVPAQEGETVMTAVEPQPIAILADMQHLRIRAEVDEARIREVKVGAKAWVSAEAFSHERVPATVIQILDIMGQNKIQSEDPKAKEDTSVLEVMLDVEKKEFLKLGLRVDVT
ncbi:MAG: HlyD family efflux transporter periplasmic adaptor subunit, partial [Chlamydiae bacterium]|nr:HlyD family efflux transporter periplasmic adaptor subunit [Chlamydiota bacterium]